MLSHSQSLYPDAYERLLTGREITQSQMDSYFVTSRAGNLHQWLDFIINGLLPYSFLEKRTIRKHVIHEPPARKTFTNYLGMLTELVKRKISLLLPETIALVFDGWSDNGTHFIGVFATFPVGNKRGYSTRLLTLSPMGDETSLDANEHFDFLTYILDVYQKSCSNVISIIGDNCNTNKA